MWAKFDEPCQHCKRLTKNRVECFTCLLEAVICMACQATKYKRSTIRCLECLGQLGRVLS